MTWCPKAARFLIPIHYAGRRGQKTTEMEPILKYSNEFAFNLASLESYQSYMKAQHTPLYMQPWLGYPPAEATVAATHISGN